MTLNAWYRRPHLPAAASSGHGHAPQRGRQLYCRPCLEPLEDRYLLSADLSALAQSLVHWSTDTSTPSGIVTQIPIANVTWGGVPTVVGASRLLVNAGQPFAAAVAGITYVDPGPTLQAVIDWGDGTQSVGTCLDYSDGVDLIVAAKTYTRAGSFAITVIVGNSTDMVIAVKAAAEVTGNGNGTSAAPGGPPAGTSSQGASNDGSSVARVVSKSSLAFGVPQIVVPLSGQLPPGKVDAGGALAVQPTVLTQGPSTPPARLITVELNRSHFEASAQSVYQGNIDRLEFATVTVTISNRQASTPAQPSALARGLRPASPTVPLPVYAAIDTAAPGAVAESSVALTPELVAAVLCSTGGVGDGPFLLLENDSRPNDPFDERLEEDYFSPLTLLQPPTNSSAIANAAVAAGEAPSSFSSEETESRHGANRWHWPLLHVAAVCVVFQTMARFATATCKQPSLRDAPWPGR